MTPLSKDQWKKTLTALLFSFTSAFLSTLVAAGGLQTSQEANLAIIWSALVAGINAALYGTYQLFKDDTHNTKA